MTFQNVYPAENSRLDEKMGVYDKEIWSCNGHSVKGMSPLAKKTQMNLIFILSKSLVHTSPCKAVNNHPKLKRSHCLKNNSDFPERLKDSSECKYNCVTSVDVRHDIKRRKASQGMTGWWKMHSLSIISFLNDSKFYNELRNELSQHPLHKSRTWSSKRQHNASLITKEGNIFQFLKIWRIELFCAV